MKVDWHDFLVINDHWSSGDDAFLQDSGPDGIVSIEAEYYDSILSQGGHQWTQVTSYTLSSWVKPNTTGRNGLLARYIEWYGSTGQVVHSSPWQAGAGDWAQIAVTFVTRSDWNSGRIDLLWDYDSGESWYDDVSLMAD